MPLSANCPHCGAHVVAPDSRAGRGATCSRCRGRFTFPQAHEFPTVDEAPPPELRARLLEASRAPLIPREPFVGIDEAPLVRRREREPHADAAGLIGAVLGAFALGGAAISFGVFSFLGPLMLPVALGGLVASSCSNGRHKGLGLGLSIPGLFLAALSAFAWFLAGIVRYL